MALDQVEVMRQLGFEKFAVLGHDRGGRVGHRMALDHPDRVTRLAVLDIVPTHYLYTHVTLAFVQAYYHWFSYLRPSPAPETELKENIERQASKMSATSSSNTCASGATRPTSTACARTIGRRPQSISSTTAPISTRRLHARCSRSGVRKRQWAGYMTCWDLARACAQRQPVDRFPPATTCKRTRLSWLRQNCARFSAERSHRSRKSSAVDSRGRGLASCVGLALVGLTAFVGLAPGGARGHAAGSPTLVQYDVPSIDVSEADRPGPKAAA